MFKNFNRKNNIAMLEFESISAIQLHFQRFEKQNVSELLTVLIEDIKLHNSLQFGDVLVNVIFFVSAGL